MFYAVLQVDLVQDDVYILQSRDFPEKTNTSMRWEEYLRQYGRILTEEGRDKVCEKFSTKALLAAADSANGIFSLDVSYKKGVNTNWLTITASAGGGKTAAHTPTFLCGKTMRNICCVASLICMCTARAIILFISTLGKTLCDVQRQHGGHAFAAHGVR